MPVEIDDQDFSLDQHAILPDWMDAALFPQTEELNFGPNRLTVDLPFLQLEAGLHYHGSFPSLSQSCHLDTQLDDSAESDQLFTSQTPVPARKPPATGYGRYWIVVRV